MLYAFILLGLPIGEDARVQGGPKSKPYNLFYSTTQLRGSRTIIGVTNTSRMKYHTFDTFI